MFLTIKKLFKNENAESQIRIASILPIGYMITKIEYC